MLLLVDMEEGVKKPEKKPSVDELKTSVVRFAAASTRPAKGEELKERF